MNSEELNKELVKLFEGLIPINNIELYEERTKYIINHIHPFFIKVNDYSLLNFNLVNKESLYNYLFDCVCEEKPKVIINTIIITILSSLEPSEENTNMLNRIHTHDENTLLIKYGYRPMFRPMIIRLLIERHNVDIYKTGKVYVSAESNKNQNVFQGILRTIKHECNKLRTRKNSTQVRNLGLTCSKLSTCILYSKLRKLKLKQALEHKDTDGLSFIDTLTTNDLESVLKTTKEGKQLINTLKGVPELKSILLNW